MFSCIYEDFKFGNMEDCKFFLECLINYCDIKYLFRIKYKYKYSNDISVEDISLPYEKRNEIEYISCPNILTFRCLSKNVHKALLTSQYYEDYIEPERKKRKENGR